MADNNTTMVTQPTMGLDPKEAAKVYTDVLADRRIELAGTPDVIDFGEQNAPEIGLTIKVEDFDEATFALGRARDILAARNRFAQAAAAPTLEAARERATVIVNMFGGPGAGKTTAAFEVAEKLKKAGYIVEYAPEYAKELVWDMSDASKTPEERENARELLSGRFDKQMQLYEEQLARVKRCVGQCDFVVTDSPILLSSMYLKPEYPAQQEHMDSRVLHDFDQMRNFNMVVKRAGDYEQAGRVQNAAEAAAIDASVTEFLDANDIYYGAYDHSEIDKAIENMQKTLRRFQRHDEAIKNLRESVENKGMTAPEAGAETRVAAEAAEREKVVNMAEENTMEYEHVTVPLTGYKGASLIEPRGEKWQQVQLPPHMPTVLNTDGKEVDISNRTFLVANGEPVAVQSANGTLGIRQGAVTKWNNDPNYASLSFPKTSKDGEAWNVRLAKGGWEHPEAEGKERGKWIPDAGGVEEIALTEQLKPALEYYRQDRADYAREQAANREQTQTQTKEQAPKQPTKRQRAPKEKSAQKASLSQDAQTARKASQAQAVKKAAHAPKVQAK